MARKSQRSGNESDRLLEGLVAIPEPLCLTESDGTILFATGMFASLFGAQPRLLSGRPFQSLLVEGEYDRLKSILSKAGNDDERHAEIRFLSVEQEKSFRGELSSRKIRPDGDGLPLWLHTVRAVGAQGAGARVQDAVYRIAEASEQASTMDELFALLHRIISTVMPANNFYIALYDEKANILSFPYFVDEIDEPSPPQTPGKGLTEYVIRTGKSLLCTLDVHEDLVSRGEAELVGVPSAIWLGVPLVVENEAIGAMVVQHYSEPDAYGHEELRMLEFMSSQIARVIERKRSERALLLSKERYQRFVEQSSEGIWRVQFREPVPVSLPPDDRIAKIFSTGYIVECNDTMARMFGLSRAGEVVGGRLENILHPSLPGNIALLTHFLNSGYRISEAEARFPSADGSEKTFLLNLVGIVENDALAEVWGTQRDVTERKRSELLIRESEEKYRSIFEGSQDAIIVSSIAGKLFDVNPAAVALFGFPSAQDLRAVPDIAQFFDDPAEYEEYTTRLTRDGGIRDFEFRVRRRDGDIRYVVISVTAERDLRGRVIAHRGFVRDITDRRRLEEQFRQAQKMEGIGTLAGGIAHDFNNLLGIILGFTQLLESGKADPERFKKSIQTIKRAIERGSGLVRQLLTFARRADPSFHTLDANEIVTELLKMLRETFPRTITIEADLGERLPMITADHSQLHQALLNLCVNSRDAILDPRRGGRETGTLTLRTRTVEGAELRKKFGNALLGQYVVITVADTGVGMDAETRNRIFEPFFTTKELGRGTGLGLSVVYGVLNSHQGYVDVESEHSKGTSFHLYFPITDALYPPVVHVSEQSSEITPGSETVLIVEDEDMLRDLLKTFLTGNGYSVLTAQNGEEGLELYRRHREEIAVVLSDMGLPRLGGWEMFQKMQEIDGKVKVILASGYFDPNLKMDMVKAGARDFIQKPYVPDNILKRIREVIDEE